MMYQVWCEGMTITYNDITLTNDLFLKIWYDWKRMKYGWYNSPKAKPHNFSSRKAAQDFIEWHAKRYPHNRPHLVIREVAA